MSQPNFARGATTALGFLLYFPRLQSPTNDQGDVVLSDEPEVTSFMRLQTMLLAPFVPEQLLWRLG